MICRTWSLLPKRLSGCSVMFIPNGVAAEIGHGSSMPKSVQTCSKHNKVNREQRRSCNITEYQKQRETVFVSLWFIFVILCAVITMQIHAVPSVFESILIRWPPQGHERWESTASGVLAATSHCSSDMQLGANFSHAPWLSAVTSAMPLRKWSLDHDPGPSLSTGKCMRTAKLITKGINKHLWIYDNSMNMIENAWHVLEEFLTWQFATT